MQGDYDLPTRDSAIGQGHPLRPPRIALPEAPTWVIGVDAAGSNDHLPWLPIPSQGGWRSMLGWGISSNNA